MTKSHWPFKRTSTADEVLADVDLSGKKIVITGANSGIGYESARALAAAGASVVLACRNIKAAQAAADTIKKQHANADVSCLVLDLASFDSIRSFPESLTCTALDSLICNAGSMATDYQETEQGFERTVGICHVGHFLLTKLLMPKLLAANEPRVIMLSSSAHEYPPTLDFENLPSPKNKSGMNAMKAYGQAKLCNALMAFELQKRYGDKGLHACSVHPGNMVSTNFGGESAMLKIAFKLISPFTKNANQGAATTVMCASHEPASDLAGQYFAHGKPTKCSAEAKNPEVAAKLWKLTEDWISSAA